MSHRMDYGLVRGTKLPTLLTCADVSWSLKWIEHPNLYQESGTYYLYFHVNLVTPEYAIGVATASAPEGPYTDSGAAILQHAGVGEWDSNEVACPCMLKNGSTYYLFYSGYDGTDWKFGVATSAAPTGPFARSANNPLAWVGTLTWPGSVLKVGTTYYAFVGTENNMYLLTAGDPEGPWTSHGQVIGSGSGRWDDLGVMGESGIIYDSTRGLFLGAYAGKIASAAGGKQNRHKLGFMYSPDAVRWVRQEVPMLELGAAGAEDEWRQSESGLYQENGILYAMYSAMSYPGDVLTETLMMATFDTGLTFA